MFLLFLINRSLGFGFNCIWHTGVLEVLRIIRQNFIRLTRALITQPGASSLLSLSNFKQNALTGSDELVPGRVAESRARLIVAVSRAKKQLNLSKHLADSAIVKVLSIIDELDIHLVRSTSRLRACYSLHFPEVCQHNFGNAICLKDSDLIKLISEYPLRTLLEPALSTGSITSCFTDLSLAKQVVLAAKDSIGMDLNSEDSENLKMFAVRLLGLIKVLILIYINCILFTYFVIMFFIYEINI